jgi:hypothetical protein
MSTDLGPGGFILEPEEYSLVEFLSQLKEGDFARIVHYLGPEGRAALAAAIGRLVAEGDTSSDAECA